MSNTMNSMEEKKMSGAIRLFEALSGVDEELLANCEEKTVGKVKRPPLDKQKIYHFMHEGAVLVAAVCVLAVGIYAWQMSGSVFMTKDTASSADQAACGENTAGAEVPAATQEAIQEAKEAMPEAATEEAERFDSGNEELNASSSENNAMEDLKQSIQNLPEADIEAAAKDSRRDITEAEARDLEVLGAYVPTTLPAGYIWESGKLSVTTEKEAESVFLTWTKGMDYIEITITRVDAADLQLTDIAAEETYNVHLYDIPYAETLPKEYRDTFNKPVFAAEDLSLELIEKRMKSFADVGDTDTPRGNFSVLYKDDVLLSFGGRGTAREIWEMFESVE